MKKKKKKKNKKKKSPCYLGTDHNFISYIITQDYTTEKVMGNSDTSGFLFRHPGF